MKRVLTYGTFDLLHYGHIRLLKRAKEQGDYLIVALSTDDFNLREKNKSTYHSFKRRKEMLEALRVVDFVIAEETWEQKIEDIRRYEIDIVVMGGDWVGSDKFEYLKEFCEVVYVERTQGVSTTQIKKNLRLQEPSDAYCQIPNT